MENKEIKAIGFIPMDLEQELYNIAKRGGVKSIKDVIGILSAIVDTNLTERDFEIPPSKSGIKHQKNLDEKTKEIWGKIEPNYKGDLKGNMYYSSLRLIIEKGYDLIKRYKPFDKYQKDKFKDGGDIDSKSSYEAMIRKYDQLGAKLEDAIEDNKTSEVARLKTEMSALETKINNYERGGNSFSYSIGGL